MTSRRLIYLVLLVGATAFYIFHTGYLSFILMLLSAIAIPCSVAASLPVMLRAKVLIECKSKSVRAGEPVSMFIEVNSILPAYHVKALLKFENLFTGETEKRKVIIRPGDKLRFAYTPSNCGVIRCSFSRLSMLDLSGIVALPMRATTQLEILARPDEIPFTESIETILDQDGDKDASIASAVSGEREPRDVREYREGDSLRDIHWKLSARTNKIIVREYSYRSASLVLLAIMWSGQPDELGRALGRLQGLYSAFSVLGGEMSILVAQMVEGSHTVHNIVCRGVNDFSKLQWRLLSSKSSAGSEPAECLFSGARAKQSKLLLAAPDVVQLYDCGKLSEEFR